MKKNRNSKPMIKLCGNKIRVNDPGLAMRLGKRFGSEDNILAALENLIDRKDFFKV